MRARDLRGETWLWDREDQRGKKAPVFGVFCERVDPASLRPAFDVAPVLCRFFGVSKLRLDLPNPAPAKLYLESVADPPPCLPPEVSGVPERVLSPEQIRETLRRGREAMSVRRNGSASPSNGEVH